ncbi:hypothetical protein EGI22_04865 [Lacihabitans sp. LS3-19]|nr:hypothetical protein [Lacihabitans sp. LS3-19]
MAFNCSYLIRDYLESVFKILKLKTHGRGAISIIKFELDYISNALITGINKYKINIYFFLSCA